MADMLNNLYSEHSEARVANCNLWHLMKTSCYEIFHIAIIKATSASFIKHTNCEIWMMVKVPDRLSTINNKINPVSRLSGFVISETLVVEMLMSVT